MGAQSHGPKGQICDFPTLSSVDTEVLQSNNIVFRCILGQEYLKLLMSLRRVTSFAHREGGGGGIGRGGSNGKNSHFIFCKIHGRISPNLQCIWQDSSLGQEANMLF